MNPIDSKQYTSTVHKTGDAVGVSEKRWYIAIVSNNTEKKCGERLLKLGYEAYVPTQRETHRWSSGKMKTVDRIVLPSLLFIRVNEEERRSIVTFSFINKFMTDRASSTDAYNHHRVAVVPDHQMNTLKFMLYHADDPVYIESGPIHKGDKVRVVRGRLQGLEGLVAKRHDGETHIAVHLESLGYASVRIAQTDLVKI